MDALTIIAIIEAIAKFVPEIPELVAGIETAVGLLRSGEAPTAEQQASIDGLLERAHAELQGRDTSGSGSVPGSVAPPSGA